MPRNNSLTVSRERLVQHNAAIAQFALDHRIPEDYFVKQPLDVHPVVMSANRKITILALPTYEFFEELRNAVRNIAGYSMGYRLKLTCPIIFSKDKKSCIVFPNLSLNDYVFGSGRELNNENPYFPKHTAGLVNNIMCELEDEYKRQAWHPISRGIKRLGKRLEMPFTRAIARYVRYQDEPIKDAQLIDNVAQKLIELNMPTDFHFADTVEQMRDMYVRDSDESPHSCMDSRHRFGLADGVRPIDFYAHCPVTRGAYLSRGSTVLARTILWKCVDTEKWFYGRVYSSRGVHSNDLTKQLEAQGVKSISTQRKVTSTCEFTMPVAVYNGFDSCPMPYFDQKPFSCLGVKLEAGVFYVVMTNDEKLHKQGYEMPSLTSTSGSYQWSASTQCSSCDYEIDPECYFINVSGDSYCCSSCAFQRDVVAYLTTNGDDFYYDGDLPNNWEVEGLNNNYVFSNLEAARRRGNVYHPLPWADTEDVIYVWAEGHEDCDGLSRVCSKGGYKYDKGDYRHALMYTAPNIGHTPTSNWRGHDDAWTFLTMTRLETEIKYRTGEIVQPANRLDVSSEPEKEPFTNASFDEYLGNIANPPASLLPGVTFAEGE